MTQHNKSGAEPIGEVRQVDETTWGYYPANSMSNEWHSWSTKARACKMAVVSVFPVASVTHCAHVWELWDEERNEGDYANARSHRLGHSTVSEGAMWIMAYHQLRNQLAAPVADAEVKRPATFSTREIRFDNYWYRKASADAYMDSLELQLTQAHGKNAELAERVKELEKVLRDCRSNYAGYAITSPNSYENAVACVENFWNHISATDKKIDKVLSSAASGKDGE